MMKIKDERWLPVKGYEGYEVSDMGNVRSLNYRHTGKTKVLTPGISNTGYFYVSLCKNGKKKKLYIHRLVVTAFRGPIPKGMVVNHLNENKLDNRLSNLEVVTQKENINWGTGLERLAKAKSKQLDLIEAEYPFREFTFLSSINASEYFGYKNREAVGTYLYNARKRGKNFINLRGTKYFFSQKEA